jgi:hypothetical protein
MPEITDETLFQELLRLDRGLARVERETQALRVEMQRCLWEAHYGREQIDRSRRAYEAQVAARRERYQSIDKGLTPQ